MAIYREIAINGDNASWYLVTPKTLWEVITLAWYLWRYPDKVAIFMGINKENNINFKNKLIPLKNLNNP